MGKVMKLIGISATLARITSHASAVVVGERGGCCGGVGYGDLEVTGQGLLELRRRCNRKS
jgi:hypothetical protein